MMSDYHNAKSFFAVAVTGEYGAGDSWTQARTNMRRESGNAKMRVMYVLDCPRSEVTVSLTNGFEIAWPDTANVMRIQMIPSLLAAPTPTPTEQPPVDGEDA